MFIKRCPRRSMMCSQVGAHVYAYFKLFHSIKDEHEVELARLELESLVGKVKPVKNFVDEACKKPLSEFLSEFQENKMNDSSDSIRFQDYLTHELPYGRIQGFVCENLSMSRIGSLVRRLAYTREIYIITEGDSWKKTLKEIFPGSNIGKNCNVFTSESKIAIRAITNQFFLENCQYVSKVTPSLKRERIEEFIERTFDSLMKYTYRIPASVKARIGKRFLDYIAQREEPSLYLSHGLHPYKGKFHPKMVRALINTIHPKDSGLIMDNFVGSGTALVEASLMGLDSIGIDVNPMSVLMAKAKCTLLHMDSKKLDKALSQFIEEYEKAVRSCRTEAKGQETLTQERYEIDEVVAEQVRKADEGVYENFKKDGLLEEVLLARSIAENEYSGELLDILQLGIAMGISDLKNRRTNRDFLSTLKEILEDIYRRLHILRLLEDRIDIRLGIGDAIVADSANLAKLDIEEITGNVNSPPYSTALDYIKNDIYQLSLLGFVRSSSELGELEQRMGGNPRGKYDSSEMASRIEANDAGLPTYAMRVIRLLYNYNRTGHAFRLYDFYELMKSCLSEQKRLLEPGSRICTVIGNNHFKLANKVEGVMSGQIDLEGEAIPVNTQKLKNNMKTISPEPVVGEAVSQTYGDDLPVHVSINKNERRKSRNGVYVEVENERVIFLLGKMLGFEPDLVMKRYLEKTLRGDIRYESILILRKPDKSSSND